MEARPALSTSVGKPKNSIGVKEDKDEFMNTPATKKGTCGCGRSPTGNCIGWHALSEQAFKKKLLEYQEKNILDKNRLNKQVD